MGIPLRQHDLSVCLLAMLGYKHSLPCAQPALDHCVTSSLSGFCFIFVFVLRQDLPIAPAGLELEM